MESKLPLININKKYIRLKLKPKKGIEETKLFKPSSKFTIHKRSFKELERSVRKSHLFRFSNVKSIDLNTLVINNPKNLKELSISQPHLPQKNYKTTSNQMKQTYSTNKYLQQSSSAKFLLTNSLLSKLYQSPNEMDEIEKFEYYDKIEKTKPYQNFLKKEKEITPKDSVNNSFLNDSKINHKRKSEKDIFKNLVNSRQTIYELLYLFNPKNMIKLWPKFKNKELFEKYIIEKYIKEKKKHLEDKNILNPEVRNIFIILDGDIIINEKYIKGFFMEIPYSKEIKLLNNEQKKKIFNNILKKGENNFKTKKPLANIFSPEKQYISDLSEIKDDFDYLYISSSTVCLGVSVITTRPLMVVYENEFKNYLKENIEKMKEIENMKEQLLLKKKSKYKKHKIKKTIQGIRPKYEIYKPHYSFADGEDDIENVDYIIYSDDEERKKSMGKKILKNCYLKNDFFLYLNENDVKKKTTELKKNLNFTSSYNLRENFKKFNPNFDSLLQRYKKEIHRQLKVDPKIFKVDPIDSNINSHNLEFPNDRLTKLYKSRQKQKKINFQTYQQKYLKKNPKYKISLNDHFYYNMNRNISKYYNPFILYNIPKLLSEYKNFTRKRLFELYAKYKDLITMSYAKHKNKFILQNGVDFETFWKCMETFSNEKKEFANKLYNQINRRDMYFLNMDDFISGDYYMHNSDLSKKLDLFIKMLDSSGKGSISFKDAVSICKESIQRNFGEKEPNANPDETALNQMSEFFAGFVFKLIGAHKKSNLIMEDLRKAVISKENELNEFEYLEMFCGANI